MMGFFGSTKSTSEERAPASDLSHDVMSDTDAFVESPLTQLPSEILQQIVSLLSPQSLVSLSHTCHKLRGHAENDLLWNRLLRQNIPVQDFPDDPYPSKSYRELYVSHHPYWFLPRYKIWFSDEAHTGQLILVRFDSRRGCIEGYRLLADRGNANIMIWQHEPSVMIHAFSPRLHLYMDDPVLRLDHEPAAFNTRQGWWEGEIKMKRGPREHATSASFFLTRTIPERLQDPRMDLWPPPSIPNMPRVRAASQDYFRGKGHKPQKYEEISETAFRMRHWSQFSIERVLFGTRINERVSTWSTLDPILYTPTKEKPYQGIYVGDYAGHGCEFLLVTHTDKAPDPPPQTVSSIYFEQLSQAAENALEEMRRVRPRPETPADDEGYRGAIEAVKITGDVHVPRGEHTFIADDIGPNGLIRIADERPFQGARIVKSRGHIASRGFVHDEYMPSQLIMISHDQLAQYWIAFGHISFYHRVDIDQILAQASGREMSIGSGNSEAGSSDT